MHERLYLRTSGAGEEAGWLDLRNTGSPVTLAREPEAYRFLADLGLSRREPALAIYRLRSGAFCCVLQWSSAGDAEAASLCHSLVVVSDGGGPGYLIPRLAAAYLEGDMAQDGPTPISSAAIEQLADDFDRLHARRRTPLARLPAGHHRDSRDSRRQLADAIMSGADVEPGEVLAVVVRGQPGWRARQPPRWLLSSAGGGDESDREDARAVSTALSTLAARVAMLEGWMRGAQRRQAVLMALLLLAILIYVVSLVLGSTG